MPGAHRHPGWPVHHGCDPGEQGAEEDEGPPHQVSITKPFALGKHAANYDGGEACVAEKACERTSDEGSGRGKRHVLQVNYDQAAGYTKWRSAKTGKVYRLPSEAEWEYAARAGPDHPWPWGADAARSCGFAKYLRRVGEDEIPVMMAFPKEYYCARARATRRRLDRCPAMNTSLAARRIATMAQPQRMRAYGPSGGCTTTNRTGIPRLRTMHRCFLAAVAAALAAVWVAPNVALAESSGDPWQFRAQLYLWLPSIDGETNFPPSAGGVGASVDLGDYFNLDNLQSTFMGTFEARKGRWGMLTDVLYLDFDENKSGTRDLVLSTGPGGRIEIPIGAAADVGLRLRGWEWTLGGTYTAIQTPQHELQVLGGFRYLKVDTTLDWRLSGAIGSLPPQSTAGDLTVNPDYWDAIIGVRGRVSLGQSKWFVPYYVDIGTGESDLTWQAVAGIGYTFRWGELLAAYRNVDYNFASGSPIERLTFTGPAVSVAFRW